MVPYTMTISDLIISQAWLFVPQRKRIATWGILDWIPSYQDNMESQKKLDKQKHKVNTVQNDFYQPES